MWFTSYSFISPLKISLAWQGPLSDTKASGPPVFGKYLFDVVSYVLGSH